MHSQGQDIFPDLLYRGLGHTGKQLGQFPHFDVLYVENLFDNLLTQLVACLKLI